MRNFILGLIVGGIAVYLWDRRSRAVNLSKPRVPGAWHPLVVESAEEPRAVPPALDLPSEMAKPRAQDAPSYQTVPLEEYGAEHQALARELFDAAASLTGSRSAERHKGSYSFLGKDGSTRAKIIIYERHRGEENGAFPMLQDGVYVLLRTFPSTPNTLGVAPKHQERFLYRKLETTDVSTAAQEIADVVGP